MVNNVLTPEMTAGAIRSAAQMVAHADIVALCGLLVVRDGSVSPMAP
jgi:hypothetical protein